MEPRKLEQDDALAMYMLEAQCFAMPWSVLQCAKALQQKEFTAYGLFTDLRLYAYISFYHVVDEFEIVNLAVEPSFRRRGYGRVLLQTVLHVGQKMRIQKVCLEVRRLNYAAIKLYEGVGFTQEGVRKHYYPDTGEDALIYQKLL